MRLNREKKGDPSLIRAVTYSSQYQTLEGWGSHLLRTRVSKQPLKVPAEGLRLRTALQKLTQRPPTANNPYK